MEAPTVEDFVVDLVIEIGQPVDESARTLSHVVVPGVELGRCADGRSLALTTVVPAAGELAAVQGVHDAVALQLSPLARSLASGRVCACSVGALYALADCADDEYEQLDLADLVDRHVWNAPLRDLSVRAWGELGHMAATA